MGRLFSLGGASVSSPVSEQYLKSASVVVIGSFMPLLCVGVVLCLWLKDPAPGCYLSTACTLSAAFLLSSTSPQVNGRRSDSQARRQNKPLHQGQCKALATNSCFLPGRAPVNRHSPVQLPVLVFPTYPVTKALRPAVSVQVCSFQSKHWFIQTLLWVFV